MLQQEVVPLVSFEESSFQSPVKSTAVILRFKSITLEIIMARVIDKSAMHFTRKTSRFTPLGQNNQKNDDIIK